MNWEAFGAISEALGVVVVLVSLLYLASQVRQSNLQAQGVAHADWFTGWNDIIRGWVADDRTIAVLQRGFDDFSQLSNVDKARFAQQLAALINHWHLAADLAARGLLEDSVSRGARDVVVSVCATAGGRSYLESNSSAFPRGPELLAFVDERSGSLPPFNVLAPWWSERDAQQSADD